MSEFANFNEPLSEQPTNESRSVREWLSDTRERLSDVYYMAGAELYHSSLTDKAILGSVALGLVFEWGPGNEWLIGSVGALAHESQENTNSAMEIFMSSTKTGVASGSVSAAEQMVVGGATALAIRHFISTTRMWNTDTTDNESTDSLKGSVGSTLALGTSGAVVLRNFKEKDRTLKQDLALVVKGALLVGAVNTALVGVVSGAGRAMENAGFEDQTDYVINYAKNPLTYLGIFAAYKAYTVTKSKLTSKKPVIA